MAAASASSRYLFPGNATLWDKGTNGPRLETSWLIRHTVTQRYLGVETIDASGTLGLVLKEASDPSCFWIFSAQGDYRPPFPRTLHIPPFTWVRRGFFGRYYGVCLKNLIYSSAGHGCLCSWVCAKSHVHHFAHLNICRWEPTPAQGKHSLRVGLAWERLPGDPWSRSLLASDARANIELQYIGWGYPSSPPDLSASWEFVPVGLGADALPPQPPSSGGDADDKDVHVWIPWQPQLYLSLGDSVEYPPRQKRNLALSKDSLSSAKLTGFPGMSFRCQTFVGQHSNTANLNKSNIFALFFGAKIPGLTPVSLQNGVRYQSAKDDASSFESLSLLHVSCWISHQRLHITNPKLCSEARKFARDDTPQKFREKYGTHYISGYTFGSAVGIRYDLKRDQKTRTRGTTSLLALFPNPCNTISLHCYYYPFPNPNKRDCVARVRKG